MEAHHVAYVFGFAVFGGFALNALRLFDLHTRTQAERDSLLNRIYWAQFFILPFIGGGVAIAYDISGSHLNAILAINVGASAPAILKSFASAAPAKLPGSVEPNN